MTPRARQRELEKLQTGFIRCHTRLALAYWFWPAAFLYVWSR